MKPRERRPPGALVATAIIHIVVIALFASVLKVPVFNIFRPVGDRAPVEQITFLAPAPAVPAPAPEPSAARAAPRDSGGPPTAEPPALVPPVAVPTGVARAGTDSGGVADTAAGRGARVFDPLTGIRPPARPDPRLLGITPGVGPVTGTARAPRFLADSAVSDWVVAYWDSLARAQSREGRPSNDWTIRRGDNTYGIDQQFIYFGKFKLPTALLAMLPIPAQGNPSAFERNRALNAMRQDIMYHAIRAQNQDDFDESVRRIRERMERQRAARKDGN